MPLVGWVAWGLSLLLLLLLERKGRRIKPTPPSSFPHGMAILSISSCTSKRIPGIGQERNDGEKRSSILVRSECGVVHVFFFLFRDDRSHIGITYLSDFFMAE